MIAPPTRSDSAFAALHAASWSLGEFRGVDGWHVTATSGEHEIYATGATMEEAWQRALEHIEAAVGPAIIVERGTPAS